MLGNIHWQYFLELIFKYRSCSRLCPVSSVSCQDFPVFVHTTVASSGWTPSPEPLQWIITCCQHYCPGKQHTRSKCSFPRAWPLPLVLRQIFFFMPTSSNSEPVNLQFIIFLFFFLELFASSVCLAKPGQANWVLVLTVVYLITVFDDLAASDEGTVLGWKRIFYPDLTPKKDAQANLVHWGWPWSKWEYVILAVWLFGLINELL